MQDFLQFHDDPMTSSNNLRTHNDLESGRAAKAKCLVCAMFSLSPRPALWTLETRLVTDQLFQLVKICLRSVRNQETLHLSRPPSQPVITLVRARIGKILSLLVVRPYKQINKVFAAGVHEHRHIMPINDIQPSTD